MTPEQIAELERLLKAAKTDTSSTDSIIRLKMALYNAAPALIAAAKRAEATERDRDEWKAKQTESFAFYEDAVRQLRATERERDALSEDKARLDWWEKNLQVHHTRSSGGTVVLCVGVSETIIGSGFDLRSAIDTTRKERP